MRVGVLRAERAATSPASRRGRCSTPLDWLRLGSLGGAQALGLERRDRLARGRQGGRPHRHRPGVRRADPRRRRRRPRGPREPADLPRASRTWSAAAWVRGRPTGGPGSARLTPLISGDRDALRMPDRERAADRGARRARSDLVTVVNHIRTARLMARQDPALSVGKSAGLSIQPGGSDRTRCAAERKRGATREVGAVIGLDVRLRAFPGPAPLRDAGQIALLDRLRKASPRHRRCRT